MSTKAEETAKLLVTIDKGSRVRITEKTLARMRKRKTHYLRMKPSHVIHLGEAPGQVMRLEPWGHPWGKIGAVVVFDHIFGAWWLPFTDLELVTDE